MRTSVWRMNQKIFWKSTSCCQVGYCSGKNPPISPSFASSSITQDMAGLYFVVILLRTSPSPQRFVLCVEWQWFLSFDTPCPSAHVTHAFLRQDMDHLLWLRESTKHRLYGVGYYKVQSRKVRVYVFACTPCCLPESRKYFQLFVRRIPQPLLYAK